VSTDAVTTQPGGALPRARQFYLDVLGELRKVTWPTRDEVRKATIAIVAFVGALGIVIGAMDRLLQALLVELVARLF
jgi:preprotein translocase subunit SecE